MPKLTSTALAAVAAAVWLAPTPAVAAPATSTNEIALGGATLSAPADVPERFERITDPIPLYGPEMSFTIKRNGKPVGRHTVSFRRDGDMVRVDAQSLIEIDVLFFTAYRFKYTSQSQWRDGYLMEISAVTDDDGDVTRVAAKRDADSMALEGPKGEERASAEVFPTNHWNPGVLSSSAVFNTLIGGTDAVTITPGTVEQVPYGGTTIAARRFTYAGDLETVTWYDARGRWVKMRFAGKDGSVIEYLSDGDAETATAGLAAGEAPRAPFADTHER